MRVIIATASWKSLWMNSWRGALRRVLTNAIITENIVDRLCSQFTNCISYNNHYLASIYMLNQSRGPFVHVKV
jgi:hypothetical protein